MAKYEVRVQVELTLRFRYHHAMYILWHLVTVFTTRRRDAHRKGMERTIRAKVI